MRQYIGNEYHLFNRELLNRFDAKWVTVRLERYSEFTDTFQATVTVPREHDGAFVMVSGKAVRDMETGFGEPYA